MGVPLSRRVLFYFGNSERLDTLVRGSPLLRRPAYRRALRYVAGSALNDALTVVRRLLEAGFAASVDYLGWYVDDQTAIEKVVAEYLRLCSALTALRADVYLSLDLTHFGLLSSVDRCREHIQRIAAAAPPGALIQIGGEAARHRDAVLAATAALADAGMPVMATLQANLRRSAKDAAFLADRRIPVRLCKGAYVESRAVAYPWGAEVDAAYVALANKLAAADVPLALATHDPAITGSLLSKMQGASVEVLLGVRPDDAPALAQRSTVRVYVPYGDGWFRYFVHRVAEARGA